MSIAIKIRVDSSDPQAIARLRAGLSPAVVAPILGRSARNITRDHLFAKNARSPNRLRGTRTNYYATAGKQTQFKQISDDTVAIAINQIGIRLHYYGGTVRAGKSINPRTGQPTKYLTIPARAEAHGKRASEFGDLEVLRRRGGEPFALAKIQQTKIRIGKARKDGTRRVANLGTIGGEILFWLVKEAHIPRDPDILPRRETLIAAGRAQLNAHAAALWRRGGTNGGMTNSQ